MTEDIRTLSKWLNEEPNAPIDRQALARVLALAQQAQEPVAWLHESGILKLAKDVDEIRKGLDSWEPLVRPTTPAPQATKGGE